VFILDKVKMSQKPKIESLDKKEKFANNIDSLWRENSQSKSKYENKKLVIKLETSGFEKRKISLKMECETPKASSSNYFLISELVKEFFNGSSGFK
jgi:hypothetical protein